MIQKIKFTKRAADDFDKIYTYYNGNISEKSADLFLKKTYFWLDKLKLQPERGRKVPDYQTIRYLNIMKNVQMFYRVAGTVLVVSAFFDTRQNPEKRPF